MMGVEAYHAALLRNLLYERAAEVVQPYNIQVGTFVEVRMVGVMALCPALC